MKVWDVYPSKVIVDSKVALELLSNKNAMKKLHGESGDDKMERRRAGSGSDATGLWHHAPNGA